MRRCRGGGSRAAAADHTLKIGGSTWDGRRRLLGGAMGCSSAFGSLEVCLLPHAKVRLGQGLEAVALAVTLPRGLAESLGREGCLHFAFVLSFKPFVSMEHLFSFGENLKFGCHEIHPNLSPWASS